MSSATWKRIVAFEQHAAAEEGKPYDPCLKWERISSDAPRTEPDDTFIDRAHAEWILKWKSYYPDSNPEQGGSQTHVPNPS